ncbi:hypothetical protein Tco_1007025 [Tanacetum coccineum]|uniref:Uncharacterized protein n=1 Tax=Tanacetum coccineum TaxID=301880 RepID=A0ABQ5FL98_9ASTR
MGVVKGVIGWRTGVRIGVSVAGCFNVVCGGVGGVGIVSAGGDGGVIGEGGLKVAGQWLVVLGSIRVCVVFGVVCYTNEEWEGEVEADGEAEDAVAGGFLVVLLWCVCGELVGGVGGFGGLGCAICLAGCGGGGGLNDPEIVYKMTPHELYKFMKGDFPRLHLNDIEDMLLLVVQNRLFNLKGEDIVNLVAALQPYTTYSNPQGVIYLDMLERNRLMYSHELYKFSDSTLISVRDKLKDMLNNLEMGYTSVIPRRRWSNLYKKWSHIMVKDIDCQLLERRLMRSLEKYVGGREYGEDFRLL